MDKIQLFHGTDEQEAEKILHDGINLKAGRRYLDFGQGFYLTPSLAQARAWARGTKSPCVLEFRLDPTGLKIKTFKRADREWAAFVVRHRLRLMDGSEPQRYDCVSGPMADTGVATMYARYRLGKLTVEDAVGRLVGHTNGWQEVLLRENAVRALTFVRKVGL